MPREKNARVVVIDDHYLVVQEICSALPWEEYGFEIVGTAKNGLLGLTLCEQLKPDIAIVDIEMPVMNGLELTKKLKLDHPEIKVLLLTSHDQFEYAVAAIKAEADDYILKDNAGYGNILSSLMKQKNAVLESKRQAVENDLLQQEMNELRATAKQTFLRGWMEGTIQDVESIETGKRKFGVRLKKGMTAVCAFLSHSGAFDYQQMKQLEHPFESHSLTIELCPFRPDCWIGLISADFPSESRFRTAVRSSAALSLSVLREQKDDDVSMGMSGVKYWNKSIPVLVREGMAALKWTFYDGAGRLHDYSKRAFDERMPEVVSLPIGAITAGRDSLSGDIDRHLSNVCSAIRSSTPDPELVRSFFAGLVVDLQHTLPDTKRYMQESMQEMNRAVSLEQLIGHLKTGIERYRNDTFKRGYSRSAPIEWVKRWMKDHLHEPLSLEDAARQLNISPKYFGILFSKEMGESYIAYLTRLRIDKATFLLTESNKKITEIAKEVGVEDANYFSRLYKSKTGYTPNENRDRKPFHRGEPE